MRNHLRKMHELLLSKQNYEDNSSVHLNEVKEMLVQCFGQSDDSSLSVKVLEKKEIDEK